MRPLPIIFIFIGVAFFSVATLEAWAGNKKMVEKRTQELDVLNKQAVEQLLDIPENGTVELKAKVKEKHGKVDLESIQRHAVIPVRKKVEHPDHDSVLDGGRVKKEDLNDKIIRPSTPVNEKKLDFGESDESRQPEGGTSKDEE